MFLPKQSEKLFFRLKKSVQSILNDLLREHWIINAYQALLISWSRHADIVLPSNPLFSIWEIDSYTDFFYLTQFLHTNIKLPWEKNEFFFFSCFCGVHKRGLLLIYNYHNVHTVHLYCSKKNWSIRMQIKRTMTLGGMANRLLFWPPKLDQIQHFGKRIDWFIGPTESLLWKTL